MICKCVLVSNYPGSLTSRVKQSCAAHSYHRFPQLDRAVASHHGNSTRLTSSMCGGKKLKNRQFETSLGYTASLSPAWTERPLRKQEQNHEVLYQPVPFFVSFLHSPETSRNHLSPRDICSLCMLHSNQVNHCPLGSQPHISRDNPENVCFKNIFFLASRSYLEICS